MQHTTLTIRQLDPRIKTKLRVRAAKRGHSMEEEARDILREALSVGAVSGDSKRLVNSIRARFARAGFVDLELPARDQPRKPPHFK